MYSRREYCHVQGTVGSHVACLQFFSILEIKTFGNQIFGHYSLHFSPTCSFMSFVSFVYFLRMSKLLFCMSIKTFNLFCVIKSSP